MNTKAIENLVKTLPEAIANAKATIAKLGEMQTMLNHYRVITRQKQMVFSKMQTAIKHGRTQDLAKLNQELIELNRIKINV